MVYLKRLTALVGSFSVLCFMGSGMFLWASTTSHDKATITLMVVFAFSMIYPALLSTLLWVGLKVAGLIFRDDAPF